MDVHKFEKACGQGARISVHARRRRSVGEQEAQPIGVPRISPAATAIPSNEHDLGPVNA